MSHECPTCTRPVRNSGDVLCDTCTTSLERDLANIPAHLEQLAITRTRQSRMSKGPIVARTDDEQPLPYDERATRVEQALKAKMVGTVRLFIAERPHVNVTTEEPAPDDRPWVSRLIRTQIPTPWPKDDTADIARWLLGHTQQWRRHEAADEMWTSLHHAVAAIDHVIDSDPERIYLGPCPTCATELHAEHDATEVTCPTCATEHQTEQLRRDRLAKLEDAQLTAKALVEVMRGVEDVKAEQIERWVKKGDLTSRPQFTLDEDSGEILLDEHGTAILAEAYRVGDVRDLLAEEWHRKEQAKTCRCGKPITGNRRHCSADCRRAANADQMARARATA